MKCLVSICTLLLLAQFHEAAPIKSVDDFTLVLTGADKEVVTRRFQSVLSSLGTFAYHSVRICQDKHGRQLIYGFGSDSSKKFIIDTTQFVNDTSKINPEKVETNEVKKPGVDFDGWFY
jgi:hypothetical protein